MIKFLHVTKMDEKERLLQALMQIHSVQQLTQDSKWRQYLHQHLNVVDYELQRQLSLITDHERRGLKISNAEYADDAKQQ